MRAVGKAGPGAELPEVGQPTMPSTWGNPGGELGVSPQLCKPQSPPLLGASLGFYIYFKCLYFG